VEYLEPETSIKFWSNTKMESGFSLKAGNTLDFETIPDPTPFRNEKNWQVGKASFA